MALITAFTIATRVAGFLFRIFLSRSIGAEALGMYQMAFSVFMVLLTFVSSGLPLVVSKFASAHNHTDKEKSGMVTGSIIIAVAFSVVLCGLVLLFRGVLSGVMTDERCIQILIVLLPAVVFEGVYSVLRGFFWGKQNFLVVCAVELFEQVARIIICMIMLIGTFTVLEKAVSAGVSLSISCVLSMLLVAILYRKHGGRLSKPTAIKTTLKTSAPITGVRLAGSLVQPLIAFIIPMQLIASGHTSSYAMSMLGIATGMTLPLLFIPSTLVNSLSMAIVPELSKANSLNQSSHIISRVQTSLNFCIFVSLFFVPLFIGAGETIGEFFFDNTQSGVLLASFAWTMVPMGITTITSAILNALGMEVKSFKNYVLGSVLLVLCILFLPKYVGIRALGIGLGACMTVTSILNYSLIKKHTRTTFVMAKPLLIMSLLVMPSAAITAFCCGFLINFFTRFFTLAVSCFMGALFFILLCSIFKVVQFEGLIASVKQRWIGFVTALKKWRLRRKQKWVTNV